MIDTFFNDIHAPEFIKNEFSSANWYLVISELKDILDQQIPKTELKSKADTLITKGNVYIGENCKIGEHVVIHGPAYIGNNVEIAPFSYIRPGAIISDNCVIGGYTVIKNTVMMEGAKTGDYVYVGDSIVGSKARFGAYSSTMNRNFEQNEIAFVYEEKKLPTGLDKLGAVVGEGSRMGGGVLLSPGTMVGKNTFIMPGGVIRGFVPADKYLKTKIEIEMVENQFKGELTNKDSHFNS